MAHDTFLRIKFLLFLFVLGITLGSAQEPERDPLFGNYRLGSAAELVLVHSDFEENDGIHFKSYNYLNLNNPELQNQVQPGESYLEAGATGIAGDKRMDIITGDFDGDDKDDILAAWEGADRSIVLAFPEINRTTFEWLDANATLLSGARLIEDTRWITERWLRLRPGILTTIRLRNSSWRIGRRTAASPFLFLIRRTVECLYNERPFRMCA